MTSQQPYPTAVEDYVKAVYTHTEWQPRPLTSSELAARLGLAPSSVTEMVKRLGVLGLVDHKPYGAVSLTTEGRQLALRMVRRHRLIETWLVSQFDYRWDEVHDEAEVLEHALSDRMLETIDAQLGHPSRDPHGDPIPTRDGTIAIPPGVLLREARIGHQGPVVRISDRDPELLRALEAASVGVDAEVVVRGRTAAGLLEIEVHGIAHELDDPLLDIVWLAA